MLNAPVQNFNAALPTAIARVDDPPPPPPIPLDGDSATIRNFGQNDTNRSRNGKSAVEA